MERQRLLECLEADFRRLRQIVAVADLAAPVPSCPGWTVADLVQHVAEVYLHKVECMRLGHPPEPWPPDSLATESPLVLLDRAYSALVGEFEARRPEDHAFSWYDPDQTVGFWIRRMAQETVIHRVDAELATGEPISPIPNDLAVDGIDEVLVIFLQYGTTGWPEEFVELLASAGGRTVKVVTPERGWLLRLGDRDVRVEASDNDQVSAVVSASAPDVLLWLWGRPGEGVTSTGDTDAVTLLQQVLVGCTQ